MDLYDRHARAAYSAYAMNEPGLPDFNDLDPRQQHAWINAADAARAFKIPEPQPVENVAIEDASTDRPTPEVVAKARR